MHNKVHKRKTKCNLEWLLYMLGPRIPRSEYMYLFVLFAYHLKLLILTPTFLFRSHRSLWLCFQDFLFAFSNIFIYIFIIIQSFVIPSCLEWFSSKAKIPCTVKCKVTLYIDSWTSICISFLDNKSRLITNCQFLEHMNVNRILYMNAIVSSSGKYFCLEIMILKNLCFNIIFFDEFMFSK